MVLKTFPDLVKQSSKIYKYIDGNVIDESGVFWSHQTISEPNKKSRWNKGAWNVSKDRVQNIFLSAFGYPLRIDPVLHKGKAVMKGWEQYKHDGEIIECPTHRQKNKVYERFIDSSINDTHFSEYRIFFHWGIDFVFEKIKPKSDQWGWRADEIIAHEPDIFSEDERRKIERFCRIFGIDFAEIDAMRDLGGRLYLIDVNNIAGNGSNVFLNFPKLESRYEKAIEKLCE